MKYILSIAALIIGLGAGYVMAPNEVTKTVEKEKIVHPNFEFNTGDKKHCDLGTQIKPCEIIGKKSSGSYVIKYNHEGIAGGDKIITIDASDIVE